jgi:hypothetical protein
VEYSILYFSIKTKKREILFQTNHNEKYLVVFQILFFKTFLLDNTVYNIRERIKKLRKLLKCFLFTVVYSLRARLKLSKIKIKSLKIICLKIKTKRNETIRQRVRLRLRQSQKF